MSVTLKSCCFACFFLLWIAAAVPVELQAQEDPFGSVNDSDKTRVFGALYDSRGEAIQKADIRVFNDLAPANEVRARVRKSGTYVARGLGKLYTERDLEGLRVRVRYEKEGYVPVVIVSSVLKNNGVEINPILWKEGEDPSSMDDWSIIVSGKVIDAKGKKVKQAAYVLTSPDDPNLRIDGVTEKDGTFRELIWGGPANYVLQAEANGTQKEVSFGLDGAPRTDVVTQINHLVRLDG